jgi:hypothetical protein
VPLIDAEWRVYSDSRWSICLFAVIKAAPRDARPSKLARGKMGKSKHNGSALKAHEEPAGET